MRAIVAGAGIAGLAAAHALHRSGWDVLVVERASGLRDGGFMIDFFGPGYDAAERAGLLPGIRRRARDVDAVDWTDESGRTRARLHYDRMQEALGGRLVSLLRGDVERALATEVLGVVEVRFDAAVTAVDVHADRVEVALSDGTRERADLLVGADGIHSDVRRHTIAPEADVIRPLGMHTAAYFFDEPSVERELAGRFVMLNAPGRMAGAYAAEPGRLVTFFVFRDPATDLPEHAMTALRHRFGDLGWIVPRMLAAEPEGDVYYDLVAQVEVPRWRHGRVFLVGDAAGAVSLVAGQGASLALAAGVALGEALSTEVVAGGWEAVARRLDDLEAQLRPVVADKQAGGRRTADWFAPPTRARIALRNLGLRVADLPGLAGLLSPVLALDSKGFAPRSR